MKNVFFRSLTTVAISVFCLTGCGSAGSKVDSSNKTEVEVEEEKAESQESESQENDLKESAPKEDAQPDADDEPITESDSVTEHPEEDSATDPASLWKPDLSQHPFYGVFVSAVKDSESAHEQLIKLGEIGYSAEIVYSPEWEELNPEPYFCVSAGRYDTKEKADSILEYVKKDGYKDAYVKFSGDCTGIHKTLTCRAPMEVELLDNAAIIKNTEEIDLTFTYDEFYADGYEHPFVKEPKDILLIVDENTVFDPSCETGFFTNYEEGDTPLEWLRRNVQNIENDPDAASDLALVGIFELGTDGNRVDRFYGCYWWD
jgi:hypothetical protein